MEDVVVESYKKQIKESNIKAEAIKTGGFDIIISYLDDHDVDTSKLKSFFLKVQQSRTLDDLNQLTLDELISITDDINTQVTHGLISQAEIGDYLLRKSNIIAHEKSLNGVVEKSNKYLVIGSNLASVVMKYGIAEGIKLCIKNYCNQKIYQANYREKLVEKEKKLGIYKSEESILQKKQEIQKKFTAEVMDKVDVNLNSDNKKSNFLKVLFGHEVSVNMDKNFYDLMEEYRVKFNDILLTLGDANNSGGNNGRI
ncbi:MAG: hypothetical protein J6B89_05050 [Bacilli bacterium]|nr:hypothetical protein [Bacilli bacterium]